MSCVFRNGYTNSTTKRFNSSIVFFMVKNYPIPNIIDNVAKRLLRKWIAILTSKHLLL